MIVETTENSYRHVSDSGSHEPHVTERIDSHELMKYFCYGWYNDDDDDDLKWNLWLILEKNKHA